MKEGDLEFGHISSYPDFAWVVAFELINKRLAEKWVDFDQRRVLEAANSKKLWCLFALKHYKVSDHFGYVDNVYFLDLELPCYLYLGQSINMTCHSHEVWGHLRKPYQWNVPGRQRSAKLNDHIIFLCLYDFILTHCRTFQQHVNVTVLQYYIFNRRYVWALLDRLHMPKLMNANFPIIRTRYQVSFPILNQLRDSFCVWHIHPEPSPIIHPVTHYFWCIISKTHRQVICPRSKNHRTTYFRHHFCVKPLHAHLPFQLPKLYASRVAHQHSQRLIYHF